MAKGQQQKSKSQVEEKKHLSPTKDPKKPSKQRH